MKESYLGYTIEVNRSESMAGYDLLYFTIVRESDGKFLEDSFEDSDDTIEDQIGYLKERIDNELKSDDPWSQKEIQSRGEPSRII